jgi:hypothetical protein
MGYSGIHVYIKYHFGDMIFSMSTAKGSQGAMVYIALPVCKILNTIYMYLRVHILSMFLC